MRSSLVCLVLGLASTCVALPQDNAFLRVLNKRAPTTDNTCGLVGAGNGKGSSCDASLPRGGPCCSAGGWCGTTADYCGNGCQKDYGTCDSNNTPAPSFDQCGPANNNQVCAAGLCCSSAGWCGNTAAYCGAGCQTGFGNCTSEGTGNTDGTCGPSFGNKKCPTGQCCSAAGYCGTTKDYCADPDCLFEFGTCDSNATPSGASTLTDPRPVLGSVTYDDDIYACTKAKTVALTYDDGPLQYTGQLLDILKQYGFTATFFVTGNNLGKGAIDTTAPWPALIKRMEAEGHQIASHTWSHYNLSLISSDMRKQQMVKNERAIANIIGKYPTYMRPPFSGCDAASGCNADMKALGYHRTYFDLDTQDYLNPTPDLIGNSKTIVTNALAGAPANGDFLAIQHDIQPQSVTNLSSVFFDRIKAKGWKGVTVGECLNDPKANWYRKPGTGAAADGTTSTTKRDTTTTKATTTKPSSTTKKPTTTQKPTSTKKPTSTTKPKTPAAKRALGCLISGGNFCGTLKNFNGKKSCNTSERDCALQSRKCPDQAVDSDPSVCPKYTGICEALLDYCKKCSKCRLSEFQKYIS